MDRFLATNSGSNVKHPEHLKAIAQACLVMSAKLHERLNSDTFLQLKVLLIGVLTFIFFFHTPN